MAEAKLGDGCKKLGFGLMRLPRLEGDGDVIDIEQTKQMVDMFMEAGCTYFDTAWIYPGMKRANECIKCGACEEACPQHISIRDELEEASRLMQMN